MNGKDMAINPNNQIQQTAKVPVKRTARDVANLVPDMVREEFSQMGIKMTPEAQTLLSNLIVQNLAGQIRKEKGPQQPV